MSKRQLPETPNSLAREVGQSGLIIDKQKVATALDYFSNNREIIMDSFKNDKHPLITTSANPLADPKQRTI